MATLIWVLLLSLPAGWAVTLVADTLPVRRNVHETWRWPFQRLGILAAASPPQPPAGRYLRIWLVAVLLGGLVYQRVGWHWQALLVAAEAWFFLAVAVIDLEHRLVLNRMLLAALPLVFAVHLAQGMGALLSALLGALVGFGIFLLIALLVRGGMGMGDVKLAGLIGLSTGISGVLPALLIGIMAGGVGAILILVRHRFRRGQHMAYAPYLVLGVWFVLLGGVEAMQTYWGRL
ncbi:MAG: A24 family peptidase [Caldilineaceae bacterium]